jgi:hypothetical protein
VLDLSKSHDAYSLDRRVQLSHRCRLATATPEIDHDACIDEDKIQGLSTSTEQVLKGIEVGVGLVDLPSKSG